MAIYGNTFKRLIGITCALVLMAQSAVGQSVTEVTPEELSVLVDASRGGKPLVVHLTSDDGSCSFCVDNNTVLFDAAAQLPDDFDYVSITMNPWRSYFETEAGEALTAFLQSRDVQLAGVPTVLVFVDAVPVVSIPGVAENLEGQLSDIRTGIAAQDEAVRGPIAVAHVPPSQLTTYVAAFSADQPLVLTFSSRDPGCPHCITGNALVDDVSRYLADEYAFARVDYDPWREAVRDADTATFLEPFGFKINGLPVSLVFLENKLLGSMPTNGDDLKVTLTQLLPTIGRAD